MRASRLAVIPAVVLLAVTCGGATSGAATPGAAPTPNEVLTSLSTDLGKVRSFHIEDVERDKSGTSRISGDLTSTGSLRLRMTQAGQSFTILAVGRSTFLRGDRAYWISQGLSATVAGKLADRWVKAPAKSSGQLRRLFTLLTPKNVAYCLKRSAGTLSSSTGTLNGRRVIVLTDRGDRPGTAPGKLYVAASGPRLPLRIVQSGKHKPGGAKDPRCGGGETDTTTAADTRLSAFNKPVHITAPKDALDLGALPTSGGATPS